MASIVYENAYLNLKPILETEVNTLAAMQPGRVCPAI
jgi:hypothetical protein